MNSRDCEGIQECIKEHDVVSDSLEGSNIAKQKVKERLLWQRYIQALLN